MIVDVIRLNLSFRVFRQDYCDWLELNLSNRPREIWVMTEIDAKQRKRELTESICWWVYASCGLAGAIGFATLLFLRLSGQLPPDDYSFTRILLHSLAIGVVMPFCLASVFRATENPRMIVWFERLGALILFIVFPSIVLLGIARWLFNH